MEHQAARDDPQDLGEESDDERNSEASSDASSSQHENSHDSHDDDSPLASVDDSDDSRDSVNHSDDSSGSSLSVNGLQRVFEEMVEQEELEAAGKSWPYDLQSKDEGQLPLPYEDNEDLSEDDEDPIENEPIITRDGRQLPSFRRLPAEVQLIIWNSAVPDPRKFDLGTLCIVNFDLARPRRILSKRHVRGKDLSLTDPKFATLFRLLRTCRDARDLVLASYHLDVASHIPREEGPRWKAEDTIYLPLPRRGPFDPNAFNCWNRSFNSWPCQPLISIQHLALDISPFAGWVSWEGDGIDLDVHVCWLEHFPELKSITFVLDPGFVRLRDHGKLILHEAEDVELRNFGALKPSELEEKARSCVERRLSGTEKTVPVVQLAVICLDKPQRKTLKYSKTNPTYQDYVKRANHQA